MKVVKMREIAAQNKQLYLNFQQIENIDEKNLAQRISISLVRSLSYSYLNDK